MDEKKLLINEKSILKSDDKRENDKIYDLKKLEDIRDSVINFQNKKIPLRHCLLTIGKMSAGITINGEIWNTYGYIKKGEKVSKDGIPFLKMSHLANIFSDRQIFSRIRKQEFIDLEKEIGYLKNKIVFILLSGCENKMNILDDENRNSNESLLGIIEFSDKYFEMWTAKLIIKEINKWETINFNLKDGRYFIARLLSKIGEFLNELINSAEMEGNTKYSRMSEKNGDRKYFILKAFKNLIKIRNLFVHNYTVVANGMENQNEIITKTLVTIREHLKLVFNQTSEIEEEFTIDYQYEHADKFEVDTDKLLKCLRGKHLSDEDNKQVLNKLILNASRIFREDENKESNIKTISVAKNKIKNQLKSINKQYQLHLKEMNDLDKINYPEIICIEKKDEIIKIGQIVQNYPLEQKKEINKTEHFQLLIDETHYFNTSYSVVYGKTLQYVHNSLMKDYWTMVANGYQNACNTFIGTNCKIHNEKNERETGEVKNSVVDNDTMVFISIGHKKLKGLIQRSELKCEYLDKEFKDLCPDLYDRWKMIKIDMKNEDFNQKVKAISKEMLEILMPKYLSMCFHPDCESSGCEENIENKSEGEKMETCQKHKEKYVSSNGDLRTNFEISFNTDSKYQINNLYLGKSQSSINVKDFDYQLVIRYFIDECTSLVREYVETEIALFPHLKVYDYTMQQVVSHVLQLIIDWDKSYGGIQNCRDSSVEQEDYQQVLSCFHKYATSRYMRKEIQSCKRYRSSGLGHRMFDFDQTIFLTETKDDSLSFFDFLKWFNRVLLSHNLSTVKELFNVSEALCKISSNKESIKFQEKALQRVEFHPDEVEQHELDQYYMKVFGKSRMICHIYRLMIMNYIRSLQYEEVFKNVKEIVDKINMEELNQCNIDEIKEIVSEYYRWIGHYFRYSQHDLSQALVWFERAENIHEDPGNKLLMGSVHVLQNEHNKLRNLQDSMLSFSHESGVGNFFKILLEFFTMQSNCIDPTLADSSGDARRRLVEMESFVANKKNFLKMEMREKSQIVDFVMIVGKLDVLNNLNFKQGMNEERLNELIEIDKKFDEIKGYFKYETYWGSMDIPIYLQLCLGYSQVCSLGDPIWKKDEESLEKAKKYFITVLKLFQTVPESRDFVLLMMQWSPEYFSQMKDVTEYFVANAMYIIYAQIDYCNKHLKEIDSTFLIDLVSEIEEVNHEFTADLFYKLVNKFVELTMNYQIRVNYFDLGILYAYNNKLQAIDTCDLLLFKCWFTYYHNLFHPSLSTNQKQRLDKQANDVKEVLVNIARVLIVILYQGNDSVEPNTFSIRFCRNKWNINCSYEQQNLMWKHDRDPTDNKLEEFKKGNTTWNSIEIELGRIGELFVILIFIMGYYKMDIERTAEPLL